MGDINIADNRIPSWTLRIEGKLLETISSSRYKNHQWPKFSSFFKSVVVELDRDPELYPEDKKLIAVGFFYFSVFAVMRFVIPGYELTLKNISGTKRRVLRKPMDLKSNDLATKTFDAKSFSHSTANPKSTNFYQPLANY